MILRVPVLAILDINFIIFLLLGFGVPSILILFDDQSYKSNPPMAFGHRPHVSCPIIEHIDERVEVVVFVPAKSTDKLTDFVYKADPATAAMADLSLFIALMPGSAASVPQKAGSTLAVISSVL